MNKFIKIEEMNNLKTLQFNRVLESLSKPPPSTFFTPDPEQPKKGDVNHIPLHRKKLKLPSINRNFDPREIEKIRATSRGSEPCINDKDLDPETEIDYKKSRTANQLANIRKSPTSIQSFNLLDLNTATILMRRGQGI